MCKRNSPQKTKKKKKKEKKKKKKKEEEEKVTSMGCVRETPRIKKKSAQEV